MIFNFEIDFDDSHDIKVSRKGLFSNKLEIWVDGLCVFVGSIGPSGSCVFHLENKKIEAHWLENIWISRFRSFVIIDEFGSVIDWKYGHDAVQPGAVENTRSYHSNSKIISQISSFFVVILFLAFCAFFPWEKCDECEGIGSFLNYHCEKCDGDGEVTVIERFKHSYLKLQRSQERLKQFEKQLADFKRQRHLRIPEGNRGRNCNNVDVPLLYFMLSVVLWGVLRYRDYCFFVSLAEQAVLDWSQRCLGYEQIDMVR